MHSLTLMSVTHNFGCRQHWQACLNALFVFQAAQNDSKKFQNSR